MTTTQGWENLQKCCLLFRRIIGDSPSYMTQLFVRNSDLHDRASRHGSEGPTRETLDFTIPIGMQCTNLFIFRFVSLLCLRSTLRLFHYNLVCLHYNRETEGERTFQISSIKLWNSIPIEIRKKETIGAFESKLRTYLYIYCEALIFNS